MSTAVKGTAAALAGKTLVTAEDAQTITGLHSYQRAPSAPFSVQVGSAVVPFLDADKLDGIEGSGYSPYAEGLWTPVIGGAGGQSGQAYTAQEGRYIKLGHLVWASAYVQLSTKGTVTGNAQISGLPFASENGVVSAVKASMLWFLLATTWVQINGVLAGNSQVLSLVGLAAAGMSAAGANIVTADLGNSSGFEFSVVYRTSS